MESAIKPGAEPSHRDLVVIGASAGGVDALKRVVAGLDPDLPATICVVLHISPNSPSALARILHRAGRLPCHEAIDGEPLLEGEILVAPPDRHLVIDNGRVKLSVGPRENGHRPAVDALFRSAAAMRDGRVIGVVLSGTRDDGSAGLAAIKAQGGMAIVQDPEEAEYPSMPANAIANVEVDAVASSTDIADAITAMVNQPDAIGDIVAYDDPPAPVPAEPPPPELASISVCPDCGGVLTEEVVSGVAQWRCLIGHRYSTESLADAQALSVDRALETAIRALEERGTLLTRMADGFERRSQARSARRFRRRAADAHQNADLVRSVLQGSRDAAFRGAEDEADGQRVQN